MNNPVFRVTADDVGAVDSIDEAVKQLIEYGVINSISVFINGYKDLSWIHNYIANTSIGLHLTFSYGRPVSEVRPRTLVDEEGQFLMPVKPQIATGDSISKSIDKFLQSFEKSDYSDIRDECACQIDKFTKTFQKPPDFINVHHDLDNCEILKNILLDCFPEWKTRSIKSQEKSSYYYLFHFLQSSQFIDESKRKIVELFDRAYKCVTLDSSAEVELVFHPGFVSEELRHFSSYSDMREREFKILSSPDIIKLCQLISSSCAG